jgi:hypothetical protein
MPQHTQTILTFNRTSGNPSADFSHEIKQVNEQGLLVKAINTNVIRVEGKGEYPDNVYHVVVTVLCEKSEKV